MQWMVENTDYIKPNDIAGIKQQLSSDELKEIDTKVDNIVGYYMFKDIKDRLLAKEFFKLGMIVGRTKFVKAEV